MELLCMYYMYGVGAYDLLDYRILILGTSGSVKTGTADQVLTTATAVY
jgi:hypothetical protein